MDITHAIIDMAYAVRRALRPHLGAHSSKRLMGKTESGDDSFAIDEIAEHTIQDFIRKHDLPVAYYTEGHGLIERGRPEHLLVIDPIDGSRPAMVGLEAAVVSIAVAPYSKDACLSDVLVGCVLELKADRLFVAQKAGGTQIREGDTDVPINLSLVTELDNMSWSMELAGRPMERTSQVLSSIVDTSSIRGGVFLLNSIAFSLTRLVTGQFDAVVDVGNRVLRDCPTLREEYVKAGLGTVIGLFPYDIAAALLIAERAGCTVTDAYGKPLDDIPLLDTSEQNIYSCVAASNPVLHEKLLAEIDSRMSDLSQSLV